MRVTPPDAGFLFCGVRPPTGDGGVFATHDADPFPAMLARLDAVLGGADTARWSVDEEGTLARFVWLAAVPGPTGADPRLVFVRTDAGGAVLHLSNCAATPLGLMRAFHTGFRGLGESTAYRPREWEGMGRDPASWPWQDSDLHSAHVKGVLSGG